MVQEVRRHRKEDLEAKGPSSLQGQRLPARGIHCSGHLLVLRHAAGPGSASVCTYLKISAAGAGKRFWPVVGLSHSTLLLVALMVAAVWHTGVNTNAAQGSPTGNWYSPLPLYRTMYTPPDPVTVLYCLQQAQLESII